MPTKRTAQEDVAGSSAEGLGIREDQTGITRAQHNNNNKTSTSMTSKSQNLLIEPEIQERSIDFLWSKMVEK